jgi:hypothetical protein
VGEVVVVEVVDVNDSLLNSSPNILLNNLLFHVVCLLSGDVM